MNEHVTIKEANEPVFFESPVTYNGKFGERRPEWQVVMNEDGSLTVYSAGKSPTRMLVQPSSHQSIVITNERIVKGAV